MCKLFWLNNRSRMPTEAWQVPNLSCSTFCYEQWLLLSLKKLYLKTYKETLILHISKYQKNLTRYISVVMMPLWKSFFDIYCAFNYFFLITFQQTMKKYTKKWWNFLSCWASLYFSFQLNESKRKEALSKNILDTFIHATKAKVFTSFYIFSCVEK